MNDVKFVMTNSKLKKKDVGKQKTITLMILLLMMNGLGGE